MARYDEIRREAQTMQEYLEINVGGEDVNEYLVRLDTLGVFYARSGALQAEVVGLLKYLPCILNKLMSKKSNSSSFIF